LDYHARERIVDVAEHPESLPVGDSSASFHID
jgi:hypothetical protein